MTKLLKIAIIASEVAPFSKTGGLADVVGSLARALKQLGHEVCVITPFYGQAMSLENLNLETVIKNYNLEIDSSNKLEIDFLKGYLMEDLPVYFVSNKKYFSRKKVLYGSEHENARFLAFDTAALKLLELIKWQPDIIHCHDWQSGLVPYLLKTKLKDNKFFKKVKSIFTIHNLVFQLGHNWWEVPSAKKDFGKKVLPKFNNPDIEYINFAKRAILSADIINTVSEQHRQEILTKHFGQDLHLILKNREARVFGIINGIDYKNYNPESDPGLAKKFNYKKIKYKKNNKLALQKAFGLPLDKDVPVICSTSRVVFQKGFELVLKLLEVLMRLDLQIIIMGDGDKNYIGKLKKYQKKHPKKIAWLPFANNKKLETLMYAGSDIFMLPSHHEPCGINQLIAMRYGCVPVVRSVGGLYDTVSNFNPKTGRGTGFVFNVFSSMSLFWALTRALENYRHEAAWQIIVERIMQKSSSWEIPAKKYVVLYKKALKC